MATSDHIVFFVNLMELMRTISSMVFVFKVLPRCWVDAQAETRRNVLNRRLARGVRHMDFEDLIPLKK